LTFTGETAAMPTANARVVDSRVLAERRLGALVELGLAFVDDVSGVLGRYHAGLTMLGLGESPILELARIAKGPAL
jgi:hypothetical protein